MLGVKNAKTRFQIKEQRDMKAIPLTGFDGFNSLRVEYV